MAFERHYWVDGRAGGTLVNGDNLNRMEAGIEEAGLSAAAALEQAGLARSEAQEAGSGGASDDKVAALLGSPTLTASQAAGDGRWIKGGSLPTLACTADTTVEQVEGFLRTGSTLTAHRRLVGTLTVTSPISIPPGATVDATALTVRQGSLGVECVRIEGSGTTWVGGIFIGLVAGFGDDSVAQQGSSTPVNNGIFVRNAAGVTVKDVSFYDFGHAAIYGYNTPRLRLDNVTVIGPHGRGKTIPYLDSRCYGVAVTSDGTLGASDDITVTNLAVTGCSMGLISARGMAGMTVTNARFGMLPGQHGLYLQEGTRLRVNGVTGANVALNLVKLQLFAAHLSDSVGPVIANVTGTDIGDSVVVIVNTAADVTGAKVTKGLTLANITGSGVYRVLYLSSIRGASVSAIMGREVTREGITFFDAQDVQVSGVSLAGCGRSGIVFSAVTGGVTDRVHLSGVKIHDAGRDGIAGSNYGVFVAAGSNITVDGLDVTASSGKMDYGVYVVSQASQATFSLKNASCSGQKVGLPPYRLASSSVGLKAWVNVDTGGVAPNGFPSSVPVLIGSVGMAQSYVTGSTGGPVSGVFSTGDRVYRQYLSPGQPEGWGCVVAGGAYSSTWAASTAYTAGTWIRLPGGQVFEVTTTGTSGSTEPTVPATKGDTVTDGTAVLTYRYQASAVFKALPSVAA